MNSVYNAKSEAFVLKLPLNLFLNKRIKYPAKSLFAYLKYKADISGANRANRAINISNEDISDQLGINKKNIWIFLDNLAKEKYIVVKEKKVRITKDGHGAGIRTDRWIKLLK